MRVLLCVLFQSPHRAYGHSDPLEEIEQDGGHAEFQSPHRAYGHSDCALPATSAGRLISFNLLIELTVIPTTKENTSYTETHKFQSPHRAYGHSDIAKAERASRASASFNLLIELTVIPTL